MRADRQAAPHGARRSAAGLRAEAACKATARTARRRPGFLLVDILLGLLALVAIGGIVMKAANDAIYLMRIAGQHAQRVATMDGLKRQLERDLLAARGCAWKENVLKIDAAGSERNEEGAPAGPAVGVGMREVRYTFDADMVVRAEGGAATHVWRSTRLRFAVNLGEGKRGDVLTLGFIEEKPPRSSLLKRRSFEATFVLPRGTAQEAREP